MNEIDEVLTSITFTPAVVGFIRDGNKVCLGVRKKVSETESTKPVWFDIGDLPWNRMWKDNENWLPKVLSSQQVNAIFLFSDDNKVVDYRFEETV